MHARTHAHFSCRFFVPGEDKGLARLIRSADLNAPGILEAMLQTVRQLSLQGMFRT
jgi:hypothetical protein